MAGGQFALMFFFVFWGFFFLGGVFFFFFFGGGVLLFWGVVETYALHFFWSLCFCMFISLSGCLKKGHFHPVTVGFFMF